MTKRPQSMAIALTLALASVTSASAQPAPSAPSASVEQIAAARDFYQAMLFDNGLVVKASDGMARQRMPEIRASLLNSPLFHNANAEHQAALSAFVDTVPALMRQELLVAFAEAADRAAPRAATVMNEGELREVAAFMRSPEAIALIEQAIEARLTGAELDLMNYFNIDAGAGEFFVAFSQTPGGRAFSRNREELGRILNEELARATVELQPRVQRMMFAGVCAALEEECPPALRAAIPPA